MCVFYCFLSGFVHCQTVYTFIWVNYEMIPKLWICVSGNVSVTKIEYM